MSMSNPSQLALLALRLSPLVASTSFVSSRIFQRYAFVIIQRFKPPVPEARAAANHLIELISPVIIFDFATALANPFVKGGELSAQAPNARKLYLAALALRLVFLAPHPTVSRFRKACWDSTVPGDELFKAMEAHIISQPWRVWVVNLTWLCSVAAPLAYLNGY